MSKPIEHELQIQRLVDGELARPQIQQLLAAAETRPELWRELAIALVEERILFAETRRFVRCGAADSVTLPESAPVSATTTLLSRTAEQHGSSSAWRSAGLWLAAAAMLLCAAGLGFLAGRDFPAGRNGDPAAAGSLLAGNGSLAPNSVAEGPYTFQLVDNQGQPIPNAVLPLLTEKAAAQLGYDPTRAGVPPALQSEFNRAGYELQPELKFIEGRMRDGRRVTVPYSDLKIRSYGQ